jgi:amphi-Trp domain-containing protein
MAKVSGKIDKPRPEIRYEGALSRDDAVSYLEAIVAGLRQGKFSLEHSGDSVALEVPAWVDVAVRASPKKGRERIRFEISWRVPAAVNLTIATP